MDQDRADAAGPPAPAAGPRVASRRPAGSRHAVPVAGGGGLVDEPGIALVLGSVAVVGAVALALAFGWLALLLVVVFTQVLFSRAWIDYLEVPGDLPAALGILVLGLVADLGVVVERGRVAPTERASELSQLAPALGVVFLVAILVQLLRRDGRAGALAGLVGVTTGGAVVIGIAAWVPLQASFSGPGYVAAGVGVAGVIGVIAGASAWVRHVEVPGPAMVVPLLLGVVAGPVYVLARIIAG